MKITEYKMTLRRDSFQMLKHDIPLHRWIFQILPNFRVLVTVSFRSLREQKRRKRVFLTRGTVMKRVSFRRCRKDETLEPIRSLPLVALSFDINTRYIRLKRRARARIDRCRSLEELKEKLGVSGERESLRMLWSVALARREQILWAT